MNRRRQLKRWSALSVCGALAVAAAVAALVGWTDGAVAGVALLLGVLAALVVDVRLKLGDVVSGQRTAGARTRDLAERLDRRHRHTVRQDKAVTGTLQRIARRVDGAATPESVARVERRVLATLEAERLHAADRHRETIDHAAHQRDAAEEQNGLLHRQRDLLTTQADLLHDHADLLRRLRESEAAVATAVKGYRDDTLRRVSRGQRSLRTDVASDVDGLLQLHQRSAGSRLMPRTGGFALDARSLAHLVELVDREQPTTVVELGSGTSTVWLAQLLAERGLRLVSIEHDPHYAELTRTQLRRLDLEGVVDLRVAPLAPAPLSPAPAGETEQGDDGAPPRQQWYDVAALHDLADIDLLLVDGPPAATGKLARWPAVPLLKDRLAPGCLVVLDDADRPDETEVLARWSDELAGSVREDEGVSRLAVVRLPGRAHPGAAGR